MSRYRVVYSRGSFGFVTLCDTCEHAMAKANALHRTSGVWHVHVEDAHGNRIASAYELLLGRPVGVPPSHVRGGGLPGEIGKVCH